MIEMMEVIFLPTAGKHPDNLEYIKLDDFWSIAVSGARLVSQTMEAGGKTLQILIQINFQLIVFLM